MTVNRKGISARWWLSLAVLAALVCLGLVASNAFAAAPPKGGTPGGKPATDQPKGGSGTSGSIAPSSPLSCTNDYVYTTSTGAIVPGTNDIGNHTDDGVTTI